MSRIINYLNNQSKAFIIILGGILVGIVGLLDYLSGPEISSAIFYLLPIFIVTLFAGSIAGIVFSVIGATIWLVNDMYDKPVCSSVLIPYWNALVRLGIFLIVTYILYMLKKRVNLPVRIT